jgi:hypothetical protein
MRKLGKGELSKLGVIGRCLRTITHSLRKRLKMSTSG